MEYVTNTPNNQDVTRWVCPTCHKEASDHGTLTISLSPYEGRYCLYCYAKWVSENVPRMIETKNPSKGGAGGLRV
jgi:hypothetical protein